MYAKLGSAADFKVAKHNKISISDSTVDYHNFQFHGFIYLFMISTFDRFICDTVDCLSVSLIARQVFPPLSVLVRPVVESSVFTFAMTL